MNEIEVKAKISYPKKILKLLQQKGFEFSRGVRQKDDIYYEKGKDVNNLGSNPVVMRIREQEGLATLTLKIPRANDLDCIEKETTVSDKSQMRAILELIGFKKRVTIVKTRKKATKGNLTVCLDQVKDLGTFVEVEMLSSDNDGVSTQGKLYKFLTKLGIKEEARVFDGYDIQMRKKKNITGIS